MTHQSSESIERNIVALERNLTSMQSMTNGTWNSKFFALQKKITKLRLQAHNIRKQEYLSR